MKEKQKILITTGIYPPKIGGPAQYAQNLKGEFEKMGHTVGIKTYNFEDKLPTGIRHLFFFFKIFNSVASSNAIFIMDTFSVGWPTVLACKMFGKKGIIRTGGDFLWEQYVERTGKKILFRNFYNTEKEFFSLKEKIIFKATRWTLNNAAKVIFSTEWQRDIFIQAYGLKKENTSIIENYYGGKISDFDYKSMVFVASTRKLVWKNVDFLENVFQKVQKAHPEATLFLDNLPYEEFLNKLSNSYAVALVSLGDISPNMIMDAIRMNRPFICTKEVGIFERIKEAGTFVDPLNREEIEEAILNLLTEEGYKKAKEKVRSFNFTHSWKEIADDFLRLEEEIQKDSRIRSAIITGILKRNLVLRYLIAGATGALTQIGALYFFTDVVGFWYIYSSFLAFVISAFLTFTLQKFWTFVDKNINKIYNQFARYISMSVFGVFMNTILMYLFVDIAGIWYILSQAIIIAIIAAFNFTMYRFFIFNNK